jgi:glycosyltransferase involved in cell wall biosynthesis
MKSYQDRSLRATGDGLARGGVCALGNRLAGYCLRVAMKQPFLLALGRALLKPFPQLSRRLYQIANKSGNAQSPLALQPFGVVPDRDLSAPKQILVDLTLIAEKDLGTGIQRVVRAVLQSMLDDPPLDYAIEPIRFLKDQGYVYTQMGGDILARVPQAKPVSVSKGDVFLGLDLCPQISEMLPWLEVYKKKKAHLVFVVYDILPLLKPQLFDKAVASAMVAWLKSVSEIADGLVCISKIVADEVCKWLNSERANIQRTRSLPIGVFHLGADFKSNQPTPKQAFAPSGFLVVGTIEPRKGHAQALAAMELLWSQGVDVSLIFCGKKGWMVDDFIRQLEGHPELNRHLFWYDAASDETLESLYAGSRALLVPSVGEGFGLPLIEAARFGLPLILRDLPVFREIAGDHAYYFQGETPGSLADALRAWLSLGDAVADSSDIKWLSWHESSKQLLATFLNDQWYRFWPDAGTDNRSGETVRSRRIASASPSTPQLS